MVADKKGTKKSEALPTLVDLTTEELKALARPRSGFEAHVEGLLAVKTKHANELASAKVDVERIRTNLATVAKLDEAIAPLRKQLEMFEETRALLESQAWTDLLEIYKVARVVAQSNEKVAKAIEPFARFMSVKRKKKNAER
jgi:predicted  nucleic acid-binding Zn-ribbon protein